MELKKISDILSIIRSNPKEILFGFKKKGKWLGVSSETFLEKTEHTAQALINCIGSNNTVLLISENRVEWNILDFAVQLSNNISVPVFPSASINDLKYILEHSESKLVFFSSTQVYQKLKALKCTLPLININADISYEDATQFDDFILEFYQGERKLPEINDISENEIFTILYTSGTTGIPKGVQLSHNNVVSNVIACSNLAPFTPKWKSLSFLPLNHILERMVNYLFISQNVTIYYAESLETIADNLKEIKPQIFVTVPRLLENVYHKLNQKSNELQGIKKWIYKRAFSAASKSGSIGVLEKPLHYLYNNLVYSKWKEALGGNIECIVSGGAPLNPKIANTFSNAGFRILEGYGLTETSPVVSVSPFTKSQIINGTVGKIIPGTTVKIAPDGEILVKGPGVMVGYFKDENATKETFDDEGWFKTGDIGQFDAQGYLKITDRKKEIFKLSSGKYISPAFIESKIKECPIVETCMVIGAGRKFPSALITVKKSIVTELLAKQDFIKSEKAISVIQLHIREINKQLGVFEQIRRPEVLFEEWSIEGGEITPKQSLKRSDISNRYEKLIQKIYSEEK